MRFFNTYFALFFLCFSACNKKPEIKDPLISGELKQWHKITFLFEGPETSENDSINPFLDYRLDAVFSRQGKSVVIPGFYAADGNAAETGASSGNKWKLLFCPEDFGLWNYRIFFRSGKNIAVSETPETGQSVYFDGYSGKISIYPAEKVMDFPQSRGRLIYDGGHYLKYSGSGEYFLKAGTDSPENFLGYREFDGTWFGGRDSIRSGEARPVKTLHAYTPHINDWKQGDPTWQSGKGKGIIGALNYLSSKGINSVYMLTNNVEGDGKDVFPWTTYQNDFTRYDVSKLEQWEMVFSHMDELGLMCHFVTQETENQLLLDSGALENTRKLYYRELIARFSHHLAVTWNLGEENGTSSWQPYGQNDQQRRDMANYFKTHDPYKNPVVVHTHSDSLDRHTMLDNLLGYPDIEGPSLQTNVNEVHAETIHWLTQSSQKGKKWIVCSDEIGPANIGAKPDGVDPDHHEIRYKVLWGNLMGGGAGVEWYFGYSFPHNDLDCENWRTRENLWNQTRNAVGFFKQHLPFFEMTSMDNLVAPSDAYCFGKEREIYCIYVPSGKSVDFSPGVGGNYTLNLYNPIDGNFVGKTDTVEFNTNNRITLEPAGIPVQHDWVVLLKNIN